MSDHKPVPPLPSDTSAAGDIFKHYKGGRYRVVDVALHSNDEEWMIIYEPLYDVPGVRLFVRPLREWSELVDWQGTQMKRFSKE